MAEAQKPARDATWDIARGIGMMLVIYHPDAGSDAAETKLLQRQGMLQHGLL